MRLKTYRASTVQAAMAQVRAELGDGALILGTRRAGAAVEVTAALEAGGTAEVPGGEPGRAERLRWHGVPGGLVEDLTAGPLEEALGRRLGFAALSLGVGSAPLLLAGPPGAGKTLTVARLATRLRLEGLRPLVISADAERAGAAEQLAAFTRLLGLTLMAACDAVSLGRALARREAGAPVLIDTGGIDPFDAQAQAGIAMLAQVAQARTALVLPAGGDAAECADVAAAFMAAGATTVVATRLDVARRLGGIVAAGAGGLALAEAGMGPDAADGLRPLTPALLAGLLMPDVRVTMAGRVSSAGHVSSAGRAPVWPAARARGGNPVAGAEPYDG